MLRKMREIISLSVALSLSLVTPAPVFAASAPSPEPAVRVSTADMDKLVRNDSQLIYWSTLEERNPLVGGAAMETNDTEKPLWTIPLGNPLVDQDPFFMRSQEWRGSTDKCDDGVCFEKNAQGLLLQFGDVPMQLLLKQAMTPILDTDQYLFLSADNQDIFRARINEKDPGEGFFFIAKKDLAQALKFNAPIAVYFAPTVGSGWTGPQPQAFEFNVGDQLSARYVFPDKDGDSLQIEQVDMMALEKIQRNNLQLAQSWSAIEGNVGPNGVTLPKIGTTMTFGLQLTGQLPQFPQTQAEYAKAKATMLAKTIGRAVLPQADADQAKPTLRERLKRMLNLRDQASRPTPEQQRAMQQGEMFDGVALVPPAEAPKAIIEDDIPNQPLWRRLIEPGILYGGTFALAAAAYHDIDWKALIAHDMSQKLTYLGMIFGGVALTSYMLKIGKYKDRLAKLYPEDEKWSATKAYITIFSQGLWTSFAGISMLIRQILDFAKDRAFPNNKIMHKSWEWTMGFALKASSSITTNWKTAMLGWIFGLADATLVAVDLLIFAPWLMQKLGWTEVGAATVAYASAAVLSQFVGYAQHGPHGYAQDVKTIHFNSSEAEARRKMAAMGLDPDNPRNEGKLNKMTADELDTRFKAVGLPGQEEFFFDPLSIWQNSLKKLGYSADRLQNMTEEDRARLGQQDFILSHRHMGLIKPALQNALKEAERIQAASPSQVGAQTVSMLKWVMSNRGLTKQVAERTWDAAASKWGYDGLKDAVHLSVADWLAKDSSVNPIGKYWAITRGMFNYLAADSTQAQRDVRSVLFAMSTSNTDAALDALNFLPKSWVEKAGSKVAANLSAELFHRHFIGYIEKEIENVNSTEEVSAEMATRADAILATIPSTDLFYNNDPFEKHVRRNSIISKLKLEEQAAKKISDWKPAREDFLARRQWQAAFDSAMAQMPKADEPISEQWVAVAKTYASNLKGAALRTFEAEAWVRDQQFNFLFTQAFAKSIGLYINGIEDSEFAQKVMARAVLAAEGEIRDGRAAWYAKLSEADKKVFYAKVFTEQFINVYVQMSVNSDLYLKAADPQFPGRLQKVRRWLVGKPLGWLLDKPVRAAEMFGRNEADVYRPGILGRVARSTPFFPDLYHNFVRTLRFLPYAAGPAYLTQRYIFQINYPYVMWVATILFGSTNGAFVEVNNRRARFFDKKPMGGIPEKLSFARYHAMFTNPQAVGELMFAEPIVRGVDRGVDAALKRCEDILKSVGRGR